ncbi:MAG: D-isomer specific 2-hydroxyacid dehydrogenase family protein [Bacteroidia bacterium]|nr:MAG: D-isomer specific 2-hydroxyacid dehydrogenase family protein [Bacteroidia bacterium]
MTVRKVVITDWGFPSLDPERAVFRGHDIDLVAHQCKTEDEVAAVVADADAVMVQWAPVGAEAIGSMKRCKGIVRYGIGVDNVDLAAAKKRGIPVRNVPDYCLDEVADHSFALMLALQRQVTTVAERVKRGTWSITPPLNLPPLRESTLGLVGFGRVARLVVGRARAFGMRVVAYDPLVTEKEIASGGAEAVSFDDLLEVSDVVSLHCPLNESTRHMINRATLGRMKPLALLVNTSRGGLVDLNAVVDTLREGRIAGAALDVFENEPLPPDHPFLSLPGALATSHIAWFSSASIGQLQRRAAEQVLDLLRS